MMRLDARLARTALLTATLAAGSGIPAWADSFNLSPGSGAGPSGNPVNQGGYPVETNLGWVDPTKPFGCYNPGTIALVMTTSACHPEFVDPDRNELHYIVNGRDDNTEGYTVLKWVFAVEEDTHYTFSTWAANACAKTRICAEPILSWYINGKKVGDHILDGAGVAVDYVAEFFSGTSHSVEITLVNESNVYDGNDFTIDADPDVTSNPVPEPASMVLLGTGLLGLAKRFRGKKQEKVSRS